MSKYKLRSIRQVSATTIAAAVFMTTTAVAQSGQKSFEIYGFAQADYTQDFKRVNPAWVDALRPSKIPTSAGQFGADGQASLSVKQSRFGVNSTLPVDAHDLVTKFEFDLFGVGVDEGQTTIRPRHAWGEWGNFGAGQTNSLFMDGDAFPNTIEYWGPSGMVFLRNPQLRWFMNSEKGKVAVAIEKPNSDIDTGTLRQIDPAFGSNLQAHNQLPDLTAMYRANGAWGHAQLSGIVRYLGYETLSTRGNDPKDNKMGWGLNLSSGLKIRGRDKLILAAVYGHGISNYMNDGGVDLAPEGQVGSLTAKAVPLLGLMAYYDLAWSDRWTSSFGYSSTQVDNTNAQAANSFKKGEYASINMLHTPAKDVLTGAEVLWGSRTDKNGANGTDVRLQVSMKYNFSSKNF